MIYLLYGDPDLVSSEVHSLVEELKKESSERVEIQKVDLEEEKIDTYLSRPTISLFGNREALLVLKGERLNKKEMESLVSVYQTSKEKYLIITAGELKKSHPLLEPEFLKGCQEVRKIIFTEELLKKKIRKEFKKQGKEASEKLIQVLIDLYGSNFPLIQQEIQKISLYFSNTTRISGKELKILLSENVEDLSLKFFKAVAQKDKKKAFRLLSRLINHPSEVSVFLARFLSRLRLWLKVKAFSLEGIIDPALIARKLNLNPYYVLHLLNETYNFSFLELEQALLEGLRLDYLLKSGKIAPSVLPAIFLEKFFQSSRRPAKAD